MMKPLFLSLLIVFNPVSFADEGDNKAQIEKLLKDAEKQMGKMMDDARECTKKLRAYCGRDTSQECFKNNMNRLPSYCRETYKQAETTSISGIKELQGCTSAATKKCPMPKDFNSSTIATYQECLMKEMKKSKGCDKELKGYVDKNL